MPCFPSELSTSWPPCSEMCAPEALGTGSATMPLGLRDEARRGSAHSEAQTEISAPPLAGVCVLLVHAPQLPRAAQAARRRSLPPIGHGYQLRDDAAHSDGEGHQGCPRRRKLAHRLAGHRHRRQIRACSYGDRPASIDAGRARESSTGRRGRSAAPRGPCAEASADSVSPPIVLIRFVGKLALQHFERAEPCTEAQERLERQAAGRRQRALCAGSSWPTNATPQCGQELATSLAPASALA